jgi:hypothetical protein
VSAANGEASGAAEAASAKPAAAGQGGSAGTSRVSVVPGIARYHTADCILIRFLGEDDLETMSQREAEAAECVPCRACKPDKVLAES